MTVKNSRAPNQRVMNVTFDPDRRHFTGHHVTSDGHPILLVIKYGEGKPQFDENYQALRLLDTILSTPGNAFSKNIEAITESHYRSAMHDFCTNIVARKGEYLESIGVAIDSEHGKASIAQSQAQAEFVADLGKLSLEEIKKSVRLQQVDIIEGGYQISIGTYEPQALLIRAFLPTSHNVTPEQIEMLKAMTGDNATCPLCAAGIPHPAEFHQSGAAPAPEPAPAANTARRTLH